MRKPEDMTPKKIKKPTTGFFGDFPLPPKPEQLRAEPQYVTIENIKRQPTPENKGLKAAISSLTARKEVEAPPTPTKTKKASKAKKRR